MRATLVDLPGTVARADGPFETRRPELLRPAARRRRPLHPAAASSTTGRTRRPTRSCANVAERDGRAQPAGRDRRRRARRRAAPAGRSRWSCSAGAPTRSASSASARPAPDSRSSPREQTGGRFSWSSEERPMAYDEQLAERVRDLIARPPGRHREEDVRRDRLDDQRQHGRRRHAQGPPDRPHRPRRVDEAIARAARAASSAATAPSR